mmetsp:Transcript_31843/g.77323  ORF Transcript_31843/g.77323 Transcript_31843/m.77323 type:complete len:1224 (+) Transcript_31843:314-3985(+)
MSLLDAAGMVTGDIWCSGAFSFDSPLKDLLDSGEYTLEQLLAEDELLQEIRGLHPQLLEFFSTEEAVAGLVRYVVLPPGKERQQQPQLQAQVRVLEEVGDGVVDQERSSAEDDAAVDSTNVQSGQPKDSPAVVVEDGSDQDQAESTEVEDGAVQSEEGTVPPDGGTESTALQPESEITEGSETATQQQKEPGQWLQGGGDELKQGSSNTDGSNNNENSAGEDYAPEPPPTAMTEQEKEDARHIRYPYMACEVICCEIKTIIDLIVDGIVYDGNGDEKQTGEEDKATNGNEQQNDGQRPRLILDLLFSMLYDAGPGEIDDYRAGYFDKILSILFRKRPQALSQYINKGGGKGKIVLMSTMFKHLYSHSIMQIIQRLLLPQPSYLSEYDGDGDGGAENGQEGNAEDGQQQGQYDDPQQVLGGEPDGDMDGLGLFRCDWTECPESLDMLLDSLIGNTSPSGIEDDEELQLSLYQNASEVLITIIQNSPLTSPTLRALTSDPVLERLILAATRLDDGSKFSNHDSRLTCAMNVLESLILQLGGYGTVGPTTYPDEENEEEMDPTAMLDEALREEEGQGDSQPDAPHAPAEASGSEGPSPSLEPPKGQDMQQYGAGEEMNEDYATADTLIEHLPSMLDSLSSLLLDKDASSWLSEMQFSTEPQRILGSSRLRIVRLLESLVLLGDPVVDAHLVESTCLEICLDLFWEFQWCSMLHQSVANLLVHVFEGQNTRSELQSYFIVKCNLLGRLMSSFWDSTDLDKGGRPTGGLTEDIMALKDTENPPSSSLASERGSSTDEVLPVSDDDVDAAMEQQETISKTASLRVPDHAPAQSFRLGYMGHVIIICQALVHACTSDGKSEVPSVSADYDVNGGELENYVEKMNGDGTDPSVQQDNNALSAALERGRAGESVTTDDTMGTTPLIITQLVDSHPLSNKWEQFVATTLASETAIQSAPLGGYQGPTPGMDPLHAHRPGSEEEEYDDDDGAAQPLPPRGLMAGGVAIDMDENDLDIAASMMAGMSLGRPAGGDNPTEQDLLASIPAQPSEGSSGMGYMFDDPLGGNRFYDDNDNGNGNDNNSSGGSSSSSSDEESEQSGNTGDSGSAVVDGVSREGFSAENEAPVMDLFAGNIDPFAEGNPATTPDSNDANWSDFANFDDAFENAQPSDVNGAGGNTTTDVFDDAKNNNFDSVFGDVKDHAMLLAELDNPQPTESEKESRLSDEEALNSIPFE